MADGQRKEAGEGVYERLLQRLALALDEADSLRGLSNVPPGEMELRDLTSAELQLIRAYLDRDLSWLRGWHAAAEELAQISRTAELPSVMLPPVAHGQRLELCCALCGAPADWHPGLGVLACGACGAKLFRARPPG
jgi:hypothetical protein